MALTEAHGEIQINPSLARYLRGLVSRAVVDIVKLFKEVELFKGIEANDGEEVVLRLAAMEDLKFHKAIVHTTK